MSSMMHMPWVLVAMVVIAALVIVGLFIGSQIVSSRKADRNYPESSEPPE